MFASLYSCYTCVLYNLHTISSFFSNMYTRTFQTMDDIDYSRIRVIYVLHPCVVGFALRNVHYIFRRKMALVVFNIFVACHNFKTIAGNYSVVRRILLIAMLV